MDDVKYKRLQPGGISFSISSKKKCSINGCTQESAARSYCKKHWARWKKHGDPLKGVKAAPMPECCEVKNCSRGSRSRWKDGTVMCAFHYLRMMTKGTTDDRVLPPCSPDGLCVANACDVKVRSNGAEYCERHYYQRRRASLKDDPVFIEQSKRYRTSRRARERGAFIEAITSVFVMKRDKWVCHLCQASIPKGAKWPAPLSGTIDHVVPLARGGLHSYANVKAAHLVCNQKKGTTTVGQLGLEFAG